MKLAVDGRLNFDTKIDTKGFNVGTKQLSNSLGGLKLMLGKVAVAAAVAFAVKKLVDFGKQAVSVASDLQEVQNVVDTAFGSMANKMEDFADTSIKQFGISRLAAKQTGSTFMAMASGMGIAQSSASDMAIALTGLSADMASFYNVEQDVASTALKSVFTGETETLKQFGIVMTEANLEAFALSQGISKSVSDMSQAEKVQLRYNYVMSQTALAQGDFAKTQGSWANQTRILSEQWKEFSGTIGQALMGVLLPAVKVLNNAMSSLITYAQAAVKALADVFGIDISESAGSTGTLVTDTTDIADSSADVADNYSDMADSAEKAAKANENQLAGFDKITKLSDSKSDKDKSGSTIGKIDMGLYGKQGTISTKVDVDTGGAKKKISDFFKSVKKVFGQIGKYIKKNFGGIFSGIWDGLKSEGKELWGTFNQIFTDLKSLIDPFKQYLSGDFTTYLQTAFSTLGNIAVGLFDSFNTVFSDLWNVVLFPFVSNLVTVVLPMITQFWTQVWLTISTLFDSIKEIFDTLWTECISPVLGFITQAWCDLMILLSDFWNEWGEPIFEGIREAISTTADIFLNIWETILKPIFDKIMETADRIWTEHLKPLIAEFLDFVGELITGATAIYNKFIAPIVNWLVDVLGPIVVKIANKIWDTVGGIIGNIIDAIKGVITTLKGIVQFITGVFTGNWSKAWEGIKNIFKGVWDALFGIIKVPINLIIDGINMLWSGIYNVVKGIVDSIGGIAGAIGDLFGADWHFSMPDEPPLIPKLATGTVVPANYGEFLAVLGDNKRETEVVSPLSTIEQAVGNAMSKYGGVSGGDLVAYITIDMDGRKMYKEMVRLNKQEIRKTGNNPLVPVPV